MNNERAYTAVLMASVAKPFGDLATWLGAPAGKPPVDLALLASVLERAAVRLSALSNAESGGDGS